MARRVFNYSGDALVEGKGFLSGELKRDAFGESGAVSSASPFASRAGLSILRHGGNAVDAAVATALTLSVTAPAFSGIGGGGFMLVYLADGGKSHIIDYREIAPKRATPDMFQVGDDGEVVNDENRRGYKAVGVPGDLKGFSLALERYGTMSIKDVAQPAIGHAKNGFEIGALLGGVLHGTVDDSVDKFRANAEAGRVMLKPDGSTYSAGEKLVQPDVGNALERIASNGIGEFYEGFVADALSKDMAANGGLVGKEDLRDYRPVLRAPLSGEYKGLKFIAMCPPSSGGLALIQLLTIFEGIDLKASGHNTAATMDRMAQVLGRVWPARQQVVDPAFGHVPTDDLLSDAFIGSLQKGAVGGGVQDPKFGSQTSHFSVIDRDKNAVAVTESLECFFGSGVAVPGTGIFLNDTMHDFDPVPGGRNSIQPGKRPMSSMSPTIFLKDGAPWLVVGSAAGPRIITAVLQVVLNVLEHGMDVQQAINAPRFHFQGGPDNTMWMEGRVDTRVRSELQKRGYQLDVLDDFTFAFGGVQAIIAQSGRLHAGADPRRDGVAAAY